MASAPSSTPSEMSAVAHAPHPPDRASRPRTPVQKAPLPEADERDTRGLLHDEPAARLGVPVQRKAVVGQPDDPLEHEADRAADRVVRGEPVQPLSRLGAGPVRRCTDCGSPEDDVVRRQPIEEEIEEEEEPVQAQLIQRQPIEEEEEPVQARLIQRQPEEEDEEVQLRSDGTAPGAAATQAATRAVRSPGAGAPLRPEARTRLERGFGVDLGDVRVHEDAAAHRSADALRAQAFAHDRHIWLGRGASQSDLHLMAHETAHVLQQDGLVRRRLADAPAEADAGPPPRVEPDEEVVEAAADVAEAVADAAVPPPEAPAGEGEPGGDVEVLMPEPPSSLSDEEHARLGAVDRRAGEAASQSEELPPAESQTSEARGAVTEPQEEANARAEAALVAALGERPEPSPEVEELCARIRRVIESQTPPDEETLVRTNPEEVAADAGRQLDNQLEGEVDSVEGEYSDLEQPQQGTPEQTGDPLQPPPESVETTDPRATSATPEGVGPEAVDLGPDVDAAQARRDDSGMTGDVADEITDPNNPVVQAREAQGELEETAATAPEAVLAEQTELLAASEADMASLQEQALAALTSSRAETVRDASGQQGDMVGSEEQTRESVAREAQAIYDDAQTRVRGLLEPLQQTAMDRWERGVEVLATRFRQSLNRVEGWIEERHDGAWGSVVSVWDDLVGLPDWITREYNRAESAFGDGVCSLLREISTEVNGVVMACERIIADARTDIDTLFDNLPEELREWAETERETFQGRLDGLSEEVQDARQSLTDDLTERAAQSVDEVRREVHELRQAARGLVGQLADAVDAFLDDPARFIIEGLLTIVGIEPAAFWAVVARIQSVVQDIADDPLGFAENLLLALGQGFQRFFDNIGDHLLGGLLDWLFSGLGSVGVEIPSDFSLKSVITFFLQVMGITWDRIRTILARHIGEENVALLERAYEIVSALIEMGPEGVFEMIKEQLDPQRILSMVLEAAIDFLVEALITQVTARVLMLFNPVGAIAQAVEAIYRVLKWIFENAARIFSLVETIVNGVADILAGNFEGMATAVESALARLIAPVIDFFAGYVGLGDLPEKIADVIRRMQDWVEGILDRVIGFIAGQARRLLAALGIGGEDGDGPEAEGDYDGQIGDTVTWTAPDGAHRLWIEMQGSRAVVMMASDEAPVLDALRTYADEADKLRPEDVDTADEVDGLIAQARPLAEQLTAEASELAEDVQDGDTEPAELDAQDDAIESDEDRLKGLISQIQNKLGLGDGDDDLQKARTEFGDRLFSTNQELAPLLEVSPRTARNRVSTWIGQRVLFRLASAQTDRYGLNSFDPLKAGQRETNPNNRSKYGYSNPSKTSSVGLQILSKGVLGSPTSQEKQSADYHQDTATYESMRPGSGYTGFRFPDAILGHKESMGASDHWNEIGHTQTKEQNSVWNRSPSSYQGPEHKTESASSGGSSARYLVPSKIAGSHSSWW